MTYSEEEIKKYLDILHNYKVEREVVPTISKCCNCPNNKFFTIESGYKLCNECGTTNGHVLGFYEPKDYDRLHYRKKSVYHRKYHYEKKVNQISKIINLTDEQKCELYDGLIKINNYIMKILNKQYERKRMINTSFLVKKILEEMGCEKYKLIVLKISPQTLEIYEKWWNSHKEININKI